MKYNYGWLFVLRFYGRVNSYGHVEPISHPLTLLLGRIRHTKRLTSTVVTDNYHWVIKTESTMFQSFQAVSKELIRVGALEKEDRIDEIKYSPPVPHFL